jgi:DNA-binding Lrp family transcriptional regulator
MVTAFVFIRCEPQQIADVAQTVADLPDVAEVYSVTGEYDIIALLRVGEYEALDQAVPGGIARIAGVTGTTTVLAFRQFCRA